MDPITVVITALVAGLTTGATETAKTLVIDLYQELKTRLAKKIELDEDAKDALAGLEKKPASQGRQLALSEELKRLEINKDSDLVALARQFLEKVDEKGAQQGKYVITIKDARGTVVGDNATVTQTFTEPKKKNNDRSVSRG